MLVPAIHRGRARGGPKRDREQQQAALREALRLYQALGATGHAERLAAQLAS